MTTIAATATSHYADSHGVLAFSGPALTHGFQVAFYALAGAALAGAAIVAAFVESAPRVAPSGGAGRGRARARGGGVTVTVPGVLPVRRTTISNHNAGRTIMHARIDNPALTVPGALEPLQAIANAARQADIPETTLYLVELRASQINGCGVCVDIHSRELEHGAAR